MNVFEDPKIPCCQRYFRALYCVIANPRRFYRHPIRHPLRTPVIFYLFTHFLAMLFFIPANSIFLANARLFLRQYGHIDLAASAFLTEPRFLLLTVVIYPLLTIGLYAILALFYTVILRRYQAKTLQLFAIFLTAHTASIMPGLLYLGIFFLSDIFLPDMTFLPSVLFLGEPILFFVIVYYLVRRALRIYYRIPRIAIEFYMLSPVLILVAIFALILTLGSITF
jgi:hypothetical protein